MAIGIRAGTLRQDASPSVTLSFRDEIYNSAKRGAQENALAFLRCANEFTIDAAGRLGYAWRTPILGVPMGLGAPVIELYRQLKLAGAFEGISEVMELGSQDFWCPQKNLIRAVCSAFGQPSPPPELLSTTHTSQLPARQLYEALGMSYQCVDVDGRVGTLVLDLNFDSVPADQLSRYGLVTNHGTSEHLINQYNVFKMMHDFTKPNGIMIHAVPFTVHLEHGFFNYQPNFFECLARYNSYETLGIWVGPDWQLASFIPWDPALLDFLTMSSKTTHLLVVAQRKMYEQPFSAPFQEVYENMVPDEARSRYAMTIDGEIMDGKRVKYLTKDTILANEYLSEIQGLKNWLDAYRGQIDGLKHELAVTTHFLNQVTHGAPPPNPWLDRIAELEAEVSVLREETDQTRRIAELEAELNTTRQELDQTRRLARVSGRELAAELRRRVWRRVSAKL
jgi:hypothetical protein